MKRTYGYLGLTVAVLSAVEAGMWYYREQTGSGGQERTELLKRVERLDRENKKAMIIRRVSEQLEEVAYQQKEISDRQRREALEQRSEAERMRQRAEVETKRALEAQRTALAASQAAEEQKRIAEQRREEAQEAQQKADRLAGLALGRSLGSLTEGQYRAGERELAGLLGYYAWKFTSDYRGDCFQPAVWDALVLVSGFPVSVLKHKGAIRDLRKGVGAEGGYRIWSVSERGEVKEWRRKGDGLVCRELFSDVRYDFRRAEVDEEGNCYALAYSGEVVVVEEGKETVVWRTGIKDTEGLLYDGRKLTVAGRDGGTGSFSKDGAYRGNRPGLEGMTVLCREGGYVFAGNKEGIVIRTDTAGRKKDTLFRERKVPVTALGAHEEGKRIAIGYEDGMIVVKEKTSAIYKWLPGHVSAVTSLMFSKAGLLSTAYDGKLNLWRLDSENTGPVTLSVFSDWLLCGLVLPEEEEVVCGGYSGALYRVCFSPERMARMVKGKLTRDFTDAERAYYLNGRKGGIR